MHRDKCLSESENIGACFLGVKWSKGHKQQAKILGLHCKVGLRCRYWYFPSHKKLCWSLLVIKRGHCQRFEIDWQYEHDWWRQCMQLAYSEEASLYGYYKPRESQWKTAGEACSFDSLGVAGYGILMEHGNDAWVVINLVKDEADGEQPCRSSLIRKAIQDLLTWNCKAPSL